MNTKPKWLQNDKRVLEYLTDKAAKAGLTLVDASGLINKDSREFLLVGGVAAQARATISISGLEELQNNSEEALKSILDSRFDAALAALDGRMK
jgi:hypothetical protein